jgi:hypothetical protein
MADGDVIAEYVRELEASLRRAGRPIEPLVDEARAHLYEDAARIAAAEGCGDAEAAGRAVARFGRVAEVVAAARKNGRVVAANVARVASLVLFVALAWQIYLDVTPYEGAMGWPLMGGTWSATTPFLLLVGELIVVSSALWRALRRGIASRWLTTALQLHGALAGALVLAGFVVTTRHAAAWTHVSIYGVMNLLPPLWVLIGMQSFAGLRALGPQPTQLAVMEAADE